MGTIIYVVGHSFGMNFDCALLFIKSILYRWMLQMLHWGGGIKGEVPECAKENKNFQWGL